MRATINSTNTVISANDYDCWGHELENRSYSTGQRYKFTGKEEDKESNYDYFGARYYDARIGNFTSIDPLLEKHFDYTPYNYVLRNPIFFNDPTGMQIRFSNNEQTRNTQVTDLQNMLPPEYSQYISSTESSGSYILDPNLLESASEHINANKFSEDYGMLLYLAQSSETTDIIYNAEPDEITANVTGESGTATGYLSETNPGLTIVSGNIVNSQTPMYYSTSGYNEVYILTTQSNVEKSKTLAHELFGHVYNYIQGVKWGHIKGENKNSQFEQEIKRIENRAEAAFYKH